MANTELSSIPISIAQSTNSTLPTATIALDGSLNSSTVASPSSSTPSNMTTSLATNPSGPTQSTTATSAETLVTSAIYYYLATLTSLYDTNKLVTGATPVSVGTPATSIITTTNFLHSTYRGVVLVTTSSITTAINGTSYPTVTSIQVEGTPFPSGLIKVNRSLSSGAEAGIGLACALIGALIAFVAFFLVRRQKPRQHSRRRHRDRSSASDYDDYPLSTPKSPAVASIPVQGRSLASVVHNNLPQPEEDVKIKSDYSKLKSRIDNHVQNYYMASGGSEKLAIDGLSRAFDGQSPFSQPRLVSLLGDSRLRPQVLRAAIARIIIERIFPTGSPANSFLPPEVARAYASISTSALDEETRSAFLSEWRVITAALSERLYSQDPMSAEDPRLINIHAAAEQADLFLAPLALGADHDSRLRNLKEIMKRAARLGWVLFSQPAEYTTDWTGEGDNVVIFPALIQISSENGRVPRVFSPQESALSQRF